MASDREMRPGTKVVHAGQRPEPETGAVMPAISLATTYIQESPGVHKGFDYTRAQNPTRYALERMVALLEGSSVGEDSDPSCGGFAFASGMAAMSTALELLDAGSQIIAMDDLYGGSNRLLTRVRSRSQGLDVRYVDMTDISRLESELSEKTAMVWVETPTNPMMKLVDLAAVAKAVRARSPKAILVCDNTFASPINQTPFDFGFDIVMHSSTKYLNGHSDVLGGLLVSRDPALVERIRFLQKSVGAVMSPFDSYMTLRGIKTLDVRMARHNESGLRIAAFLESHPGVERVLHPGLASHPQHALAQRQMRGCGGMISFFIKGGLEPARKLLESVRLFALAESLGGVESLIEHPAIMTHASVAPDVRASLGITDALIRISVGIEDCDDLIADLDGALAAATGVSSRAAARSVHGHAQHASC